jgi:hypothetical protein
MPDEKGPQKHPFYHAEAWALDGHLHRPLHQPIPAQGYVSIPHEGGYRSARVENYRVESVLSFRSAYTQVAGSYSQKPNHGPATLATAVLENLNVLDVVTADRIVAQIGTDYRNDSVIPSVTFLGTRFENLRIAGHPIHPELDAGFLGDGGHNARWTHDAALGNRISQQKKHIESQGNLPPGIFESYNQLPSSNETMGSIGCSLVNDTKGSFPGRGLGHVIDVPHFGRIYLAVLRIRESVPGEKTGLPLQTEISLTMIKIQMGCLADGPLNGGNAVVNGGTKGNG